MPGKGYFLKKSLPIMAMFFILQLFVLPRPCRAETSWYDVSGSLRDSFSGNQAFSLKNILGFIFLAVLFYVVYQILKVYMQKEEQISRRRRKRVPLRPLNPMQKRYWFRMQTNAEIKWEFAEEALKAKKVIYKKDHLVDISGGGLCFATAEKVEPGEELTLLVNVGEGKILNLKGTVVRVQTDSDSQDGSLYRVSLQFVDILSGERDSIVNMIMSRQRDSIQKDKGQTLQEDEPEDNPGEEDVQTAPDGGLEAGELKSEAGELKSAEG